MNADVLIAALANDLRPVRRLWSPTARAALWIAVVAGAALALLPFVQPDLLLHKFEFIPGLGCATAGAALTAAFAAWAAFQSSVPGRSPSWTLLPLPPAILWIAASGWGCLDKTPVPGMPPATLHDAMNCVMFITLVSVPLSLLLLLMLRRACPLWPGRAAAMAGLAAAAAAATLLTLFHNHDASAIDLIMHAIAVAAVVLATRWLSGSRTQR